VLKILLGAQLRRLRERAGVTRDNAGYCIRVSDSGIARLELGRVSFRQRDVSDLLELYQVDPATKNKLIQLTARTRAIPWWQEYRDVVPDWFQAYVGLEEAAALIRSYEVQFVPALLQTEEYARAVLVQGSPNLTPEEVDSRVAVCVGRQELLARDENQPRLWAIVDEAALRRPMGGRKVLARQVSRLIEAVGEPNVTLQVLPFIFGGHAALGGPFTILRFPQADLPDIVYMEYLTGGHYIDRPEEVEVYLEAMDRLASVGTSPEMTKDILYAILRET
jgi:transcriptional regulator with XRE-family HTH domain